MTADTTGWQPPRQAWASLLGRDDELATMEDALEEVRSAPAGAAQARIVTLLGPAGIGKTRLIQDFILRQRERASGQAVKVYRTSSRNIGTSYGLFARLLRARFGLVEGMDPARAKGQVRAQVAKVLEDRKVGDVVYFLGQFLDLPFEESPLTRAVRDDSHQGELLRRAVFKAFIEADAQAVPLIMVFDDLHLAHDDSLALLRYLLEYLQARVLVLCSARTELTSRYEDWDRIAEDRHDLLELDTLDDADATEMMEALLKPCSADVQPLVDAARSFAGGNPMMLEQMVRIYHDVGVLEEQQTATGEPQWAVHLDKLSSARLPMTIDDAVNARIAALDGEEKQLLEYASVMGSVFWRGGFLALVRDGEESPEYWKPGQQEDQDRIDEVLADLVERDYILKLPDSTFPGTDEYIFKHNKERVAIERRVSSAVRKNYHRVIADWMEHQREIHSNEEYVAMLAQHRELGGDHYQAGLTYLLAGNLARARYANNKAAEYYQRGLELVGEGAVVQRIEALHNYGDVLQLTGKVDDALASFGEMLTLAYRLDLRGKGGAAHNRIGRLYREIGSLDQSAAHFETALALFESAGDERGVASTIDDIGKLHWMRGEYDLALRGLREGLRRRQQLGDRRSIALSLNNLGLVLQDSGDFKEALAAFEHSLQIRREIGDLVGVVVTLNNLGTVAQDQKDFGQALRLFEEAREVAEEMGDRNRLALILTNVGETHYSTGQPDKAIEVLHQAEELCDELGDKLGLAEALRGLGKAYLLNGDLVRARDCIGRAVDLFASVRSKVHLGSALRTLGEITAAGGWGAAHTKSAREYYARSVAIFEQTGNEIELGRTFDAYARFLRSEPEFAEDEGAQQEAEQMEARAKEIFERLRVSAADFSGPARAQG
ncbi:MAG: tetratricopeptide repeat protein [Deltaproteobacteria bacterium]|jgi:tetratricopeptide (TPR) repeat protein|nr:tetratricopeptide repeat protein [Deltaproteobacteria bacterium]MBW2537481.1 tetratricopeptide repeat protein [Deltaproteobacteria bacterium]